MACFFRLLRHRAAGYLSRGPACYVSLLTDQPPQVESALRSALQTSLFPPALSIKYLFRPAQLPTRVSKFRLHRPPFYALFNERSFCPPVSLTPTKVDPAFLAECLKASDSAVSAHLSFASPDDTVVSRDSLPPSPTTTLGSPTVHTTLKSPVMASNERLRQLLAAYPAAITDFFGCGMLCLFKTGPAWPVAQGQASNLVRAARPIYDLEKAATWLQTAQRIVSRLDALDVKMQLTAVDPLAYANAGAKTLICDFVVIISVKPNSLAQADAAQVVAPTVLALLEVSLEFCARVYGIIIVVRVAGGWVIRRSGSRCRGRP